jgi:SNF2 family DNA or RNA helicase
VAHAFFMAHVRVHFLMYKYMAMRKARLTEKQITAIGWAMKALQAPEKIAYLFDEMGIGKTITTIASVLHGGGYCGTCLRSPISLW